MKKYVLVGCGMRGVLSYAVPMVKEFSDCAELVGVYDPNKGRMKHVSELCSSTRKKETPIPRALPLNPPNLFVKRFGSKNFFSATSSRGSKSAITINEARGEAAVGKKHAAQPPQENGLLDR